jgi:hypothetical protein
MEIPSSVRIRKKRAGKGLTVKAKMDDEAQSKSPMRMNLSFSMDSWNCIHQYSSDPCRMLTDSSCLRAGLTHSKQRSALSWAFQALT